LFGRGSGAKGLEVPAIDMPEQCLRHEAVWTIRVT
jgi:hypothetical protein